MVKGEAKGPRTIWKGTIGFGMVVVPVGLYTVADDKRTGMFHNLHAECGSPLKAPRFCPKCNRQLTEADKIWKGVEIGKDTYVPIKEEELEAVKLESTHSLQIEGFMKGDVFDPRWFAGKDAYYISPQEAGGKAFTLLMKAMAELGVVAFTKVAIRDKEQLCVIRPFDGVLLLQTIHWADELKDNSQLAVYIPVSDGEMGMAKQLIGAMTKTIDPASYKDEYRQAVVDMVEAKLAGQIIEAPKPVVEKKAEDLMAALEASLKAMGSK